MTCRECAEFLMQYVSGELPKETSDAFSVHLSRCPNCDEYLREYRDTITAGRLACKDEAGLPDLPDELVRAILAARKG